MLSFYDSCIYRIHVIALNLIRNYRKYRYTCETRDDRLSAESSQEFVSKWLRFLSFFFFFFFFFPAVHFRCRVIASPCYHACLR